MLTSKRQAKRTARVQTGLSVKACEKLVGDLETVKDGERQKVRVADLNAAIRNALKAPVDITIRPISPKVRDRWFGGETR